MPGGYLGVDIFFVISGFVITSSLHQRPSKNLRDFIGGFYERRIKRLVPALSVFVLITSMAICVFNPEPDISLKTGLTSLFGLSNLYLFKEATDYFAQSTELNVFTHTWSLGVEEQFYILFPFLIWFSGFGRQTKNGARNLFLIVGTLTIASFIAFLYLYPSNQPAAYFLMPTRFWEMSSGCLLFIGLLKRKSIEQVSEKISPILVLVFMVGIMFLPIYWATASTVAIVVLTSVLIVSLKKQTAAYKFFTNPKVVYIGLISYSLYLWHWGFLSISRWTIGIHWWSIPLQVALMLGIAIASYQYIETPLRKGNWFGKRWKTIVIGGGLIVTLSGTLIALEKTLKRTLWIYVGRGNDQFEKLRTRSRNFRADRGKRGYFGKNCHYKESEFELSSALENCLLESDKRQRTFFFVGNSHTDHHRTLHYKLHKEKKVNIFSPTISACTFPIYKNNDNCNRTSQSIIKNWILENIKEEDVVVISNRNNSTFQSKSQWLFNQSSISAINEFSKLILSKGAKVVLFAPTPEYEVSVQECRPYWFRPFTNVKCTKTIEQVKEEKSKVYFLINNYLDEKIYIYDPIPDICFGGICSMTDKESKPLYYDEDHLSDYANSEYLFPGFVSFLEKHNLL